MHCVTRLLLGSLLLCCGADARAQLVVDPTTRDFGSVLVGTTSPPRFVTLSNSGNTTLTVVSISPGLAAGDFARAGGTCGEAPFTLAAQASCTLGYTFTAAVVAPVTRTQRATPNVGNFVEFQLTARGTDEALTSSGSLNFPRQALGDTAGPLYVTLSNRGTTNLTVVSLTPASGVFARVGGSCSDVPFALAANASCTLGYTFRPQFVGNYNQLIRATPNVGPFTDFTLNGEGGEGVLRVQARNVRFVQPVRVGEISEEYSFTLENTSRFPLRIFSIGPRPVPAVLNFQASGGSCPTPPFTITEFSNCTVGYVFAPKSAGELQMDVYIENSYVSAPSVTLSGLAVPHNGSMTITPTSALFGDQLVSSTSAPLTVTLGNAGTDPLIVTTLDAANAPFVRSGGSCSATPITIAAAGSCTLHYTFSPTATGPANQTLTVTANAPGSGTIALSGNGVQGNLTISPDGVQFGNVEVASTSGLGTITLGNDGTGGLTVNSLTLANLPFGRTNDGTCGNVLPFTIAAGATCTITYRFTPTAVGPVQQTIAVAANSAGETTFTLDGTGTLRPNAIFANGFEG